MRSHRLDDVSILHVLCIRRRTGAVVLILRHLFVACSYLFCLPFSIISRGHYFFFLLTRLCLYVVTLLMVVAPAYSEGGVHVLDDDMPCHKKLDSTTC